MHRVLHYDIVKKNPQCPRGVMIKAMDYGIVGKRVRIPVARSLSGKYLWESYEPPYTPSYE